MDPSGWLRGEESMHSRAAVDGSSVNWFRV